MTDIYYLIEKSALSTQEVNEILATSIENESDD